MVAYIRHQPRCKHCLMHDNSYLFAAWYDISQAQADRLADSTSPTTRPKCHSHCSTRGANRSMRVRPAGSDGYEDGYIDLESMEITLVRIDPSAPRGHTREAHDLTQPEAWRALEQHSLPTRAVTAHG